MDDNDKDRVDIPIKQVDLVMFDNTVSSVKEKFIAELKHMNKEMEKFSSDLTRPSAESSSLQSEIVAASKSCERQCKSSKRQSNWDSIASSPLVECEAKDNTLKLQFDVSQFDPNKVTVKIQNETLLISAADEKNCNNSSTSRQYYREFKFPKGIDPCTINSTLSKDGVLTVQAPLPQQATTDSSGRCSPKCKQ